MAKSIEEVKGIGPASAALLSSAGIGTIKKLATASIADVAAVKGFSEIRATRVIEAAKTLVASEQKSSSKTKAPKSSSEKKKKDIKKKKDKKSDKKKTEKKKATKKSADKKKGNKKGKKKK